MAGLQPGPDPGTSAAMRGQAHGALSLTTMSSSRARPSKRQRTFGAPTADDDPAARLSQGQYKNPVSTRSVGGPLPTLATFCARAFVKHIEKLSADQKAWEAVLRWLKLIPEQLVPKLFAILKSAHPTLLKSEFIVCVSCAHGVSGGHRLMFLFLLEFHAWTVSVLDQRSTRCPVPHDPKHLPDGPIVG
jgi:hypothetical protein